MEKINLQFKAIPMEGLINCYWFENKHIGLENTLFHRIQIPFEPLDSDLDWVSQPESPTLTVDWLNLKKDDPSDLDGLNLSSKNYPKLESSIYIGTTHNWITIKRLEITVIGKDTFEFNAEVSIDFESEGLALNEDFDFTTKAVLK